jgi:hypothetical protein
VWVNVGVCKNCDESVTETERILQHTYMSMSICLGCCFKRVYRPVDTSHVDLRSSVETVDGSSAQYTPDRMALIERDIILVVGGGEMLRGLVEIGDVEIRSHVKMMTLLLAVVRAQILSHLVLKSCI